MPKYKNNFFKNTFERIFPKGYKDEAKTLALMSIPVVLGCISQVFFPIISIIFCGHLGANELDGVSLANSLIYILVLSNSEGLATACDTLFPQIFGGNDKKKIGLLLQKAILITVISMFGSAGLLLCSKRLMYLIVEEPEVIRIADEYILVFMPTIIFYNLGAILSKYIQSQNIIYPIMTFNLIAIILNALLHALFIFGLNMGIRGAALSVDIASFSLVVFLILYIYFKKIYVDSWTAWSFECLYEWKIYLKLAIPGLFSILIEWSNFELGNFAASSIDKIQLGLMSIAQQVLFICFQFPFGIALAANIRIGQFLGANKPDEAVNTTKVAYTISAFMMILNGILIFSTSNVMAALFTTDKTIQEKAPGLLKLISFIHILDSLQGTNSGILRACGSQLHSSIVLFIGFYLVGSPIGLSLMLKTPLKIYGFLIGIIIGCIVLCSLQFYLLSKMNWIDLAKKAHGLFDNSDQTHSIQNPNYESSTNDESTEKNNKIIENFDISEPAVSNRASIKIQLLKRLSVLIFFILFLCLSIFIHQIK